MLLSICLYHHKIQVKHTEWFFNVLCIVERFNDKWGFLHVKKSSIKCPAFSNKHDLYFQPWRAFRPSSRIRHLCNIASIKMKYDYATTYTQPLHYLIYLIKCFINGVLSILNIIPRIFSILRNILYKFINLTILLQIYACCV